MYVSVNYSGLGNAYYWNHIDGDNQELLQIDVSVSSSTPIGHVVEFNIISTNLEGEYSDNIPFYLPVGQFIEGFENGILSQRMQYFSCIQFYHH